MSTLSWWCRVQLLLANVHVFFFFEMSTFFCVTDFYLIEANVFSVYVL